VWQTEPAKLWQVGLDGWSHLMDAKGYSRLAAVIFAIIAMLQLLRALSGWPLTLNGVPVPIWASWVACFVLFAIAWLGFSASKS
jgi:hypothetical protein